MKVAVIGAGVIGAAVGWHLSRRGADVLFLDRGEPGAGVTDWTFSWVNASNKTQTRDYFELSVAGMSGHYRLAAEIGADGWWHPNGHLRWAGAGGTAEALQAKVSLLTSWGYDVTLWEAERVQRLLEPAVRFPADDTPVAVYFREGWIDGRALTAALVGGALRRGARALFGTPARDIVTARGRVTAVVTGDKERHRVDAVVNAAGPDGDKIAALAGRALPMRYEPGLVARPALRQCPDPAGDAHPAYRTTARRPRAACAAQPGDRQPAGVSRAVPAGIDRGPPCSRARRSPGADRVGHRRRQSHVTADTGRRVPVRRRAR